MSSKAQHLCRWPTTKGRCTSTSPNATKKSSNLRQKLDILTLLHRNSHDFQSKTTKIFNFENPRPICILAVVFPNLAIIEIFFDILPLSFFLTHNQQISQTKFSKVPCKILKSIYWMADKNRARDFSQAPHLTFNNLTSPLVACRSVTT